MEDVQAGFYFLSFIISAIIAVRYVYKNKYLLTGIYFLFAIGMLIICLEEISWGQRIFGIENPDYFEEHNTQKEISIHNLSIFQHLLSEIYILIGFYGAFAWFLAKKFFGEEKQKRINFLYPEWYLSSYFLVVFIVYFFLEWILPLLVTTFGFENLDYGNFFVWRDQEPAEFILAMGFLAFILDTLFKQSRTLKSNNEQDIPENEIS